VQRSQLKIAILAVMLMAAATGRAAGPAAAVAGVVRDAQGVAQMGALVQVLAQNSAMVGTAFTDLQGRYLIANLVPGKYEVRATATLYVPALRGNLQLRPGAKAIVNLTLNALFDSASWLPAERRRADEPSDDWKWTLRSSANQPILRLVEDDQVMMVSSSATETVNPWTHAHASVISGDGGFARGGIHNVVSIDRVLDDGSDMTLRADLGTQTAPLVHGPSTELAAGYQRRLGFAGEARTVVGYQSHPEIVGSGGVSRLDAMQMGSAQKMQLGDAVEVEVGSAVYVVHTANYSVAPRPFLRLTAHPVSGWNVGYRFATSRDLQSFQGLDTVQMEAPVTVMSQGWMQTERGLHQEFSAGHKLGKGLVQVAYYHDNMNRVAVSGIGSLTPGDLALAGAPNTTSSGIVADTATDTFRLLGSGYTTRGMNILISEPLTPAMWVAFEYSNGAALSSGDGALTTLPNVADDLKPVVSQSVTVAVKGRVIHSGTNVRAAYRWQPERLVTAVNPYAAFSDQAYLSFYVRQPIHCGSLLPPGLEATIDVTNLLAQGYRPFLSNDGQTLFLAQSPRTIQAGLAFNF
jgi:Carboxypeptidase regulatory-like domain